MAFCSADMALMLYTSSIDLNGPFCSGQIIRQSPFQQEREVRNCTSIEFQRRTLTIRPAMLGYMPGSLVYTRMLALLTSIWSPPPR